MSLRPTNIPSCDTDMTAADLQQHLTTWNWRSDAGCANAMTTPSFAERVAHRAGFDRSCIHVHQYAITALVDQIKQIIL